MKNNLTKEKIENFIEEAVKYDNYYLTKALASKPYQISTIEEIVDKNNGVIIGSAVIFDTNIEQTIFDIINKKESSKFIIVSNEEELNTLNKFLEEKKVQEKSEISATPQEIDIKIKETIKKYTTEEKEENIEVIFKIVKEAEKEDSEGLKKKMGEVYNLGYSQKHTTEIFMANPTLKVNKNTLVVKRVAKEED